MSSWCGRVVMALACLLALGGCETSTRLGDLFPHKSDDQPAAALAEATPGVEPDITGSVAERAAADAGLLGGDPSDDLNLGKKQYRAGNFGLAERYFRRAVETHPRDAEAWVGLAAAYDRLRRFELADRAYAHAIKILGPTPEILNNQGYSYLLRGDYRHAREKLVAARDLDPGNPYIQNNLDLLAKSARPR